MVSEDNSLIHFRFCATESWFPHLWDQDDKKVGIVSSDDNFALSLLVMTPSEREHHRILRETSTLFALDIATNGMSSNISYTFRISVFRSQSFSFLIDWGR